MSRTARAAAAVAATLTMTTVLSGPAGAATHSWASSRAHARHEARHLLGLARLPRGSTRTSTAPKVLRRGPVVGIPGAAHVDLVQYWRVPLGTVATRRWVRQHRPAGLRKDGTASASGPGGPSVFGYAFAARHSTATWTNAALDYSIRPGRHTTLWRVDATALPYDPHPLRDRHSGQGLDVRAASGCPRRDRGASGVAAARRGPQAHLVPRGPVTSVLVCSYSGLDPAHHARRFTLVASHDLSGSTAVRLQRLARHSSLRHIRMGAIPCPMDDASVIIAALHYRSGRDVDLWFSPTGCTSVANGRVVAVPWSPGHGYARLTRDLRHPAR